MIAEWTGVPLNRLSQNEMSVITDLPVWLGGTIKGQDLAIASLHKHLLTARADLRRRDARLVRSCWLAPAAWVKPKPSCNWRNCSMATSIPDHHQYV